MGAGLEKPSVESVFAGRIGLMDSPAQLTGLFVELGGLLAADLAVVPQGFLLVLLELVQLSLEGRGLLRVDPALGDPPIDPLFQVIFPAVDMLRPSFGAMAVGAGARWGSVRALGITWEDRHGCQDREEVLCFHDTLVKTAMRKKLRGKSLIRAGSLLSLSSGHSVIEENDPEDTVGGMSIPLLRLLLVAAVMTLGLSQTRAVEIQGVSVPPSATVAGQSLSLNGAGLRTFKLLMVPIKIYVAALYTPSPMKSAEAVSGSSGPLRFDFTFLREVGRADVTKAWSAQFAQSVTHTYPGYERDRDAFIAMFGPLGSGGVERVDLVGNDTVVYDSGVPKGKIAGRDFQQSFLSLWFGSKPVSKKLRAALLGN